MNTTNQKLLQFGVFKEQLRIDEQMLPYTGKHSVKQFMHNKPVKFGYKLWILASSDGYPFVMEVYTGKDSSSDASSTQTTLGERVVTKLLSNVDDLERQAVTFDNFSPLVVC